MIVKDIAGERGNKSMGYLPTSASWVGSSDTVSNLDRKLRMALKAYEVARGRDCGSRV
jgi:hypothetical protein